MRARTDWPRDIVGAKKDTTASRPPIKRNAGSEFREYSPYLLTSKRMFSNTALPISVFIATCSLSAFFRRHSTPRSCQRRVASSDGGKAIHKGYQLLPITRQVHDHSPTHGHATPTRPHTRTRRRTSTHARTRACAMWPHAHTPTPPRPHARHRKSKPYRKKLSPGTSRVTRRPVPQTASKWPARGRRCSPAWARGRECIRSRPPPQSQGFPPRFPGSGLRTRWQPARRRRALPQPSEYARPILMR